MPRTRVRNPRVAELSAKPTLSLKEACELLGISESTGLRLNRINKFPVPVIHGGPRTHRVPTRAVLALLGEGD